MLAVCHGLEISKLVSITAPCPFNYLIAAPDEVQAGYLRDVIPAFYKSVVQSGDLQAGLALLAAPLKLFHCGEWFYRTLATFMVTSFNAAGRAEVVEQIVTDQVEKAGYRNREMIRAARARAKAYVKSPHGFYNRHRPFSSTVNCPFPTGISAHLWRSSDIAGRPRATGLPLSLHEPCLCAHRLFKPALLPSPSASG